MINWKTISLKELAGYISEELRKKGIEIILVGGACVTIYSANRYQSYDLDFVTYEDMKKVNKVLQELGFAEENGYFQHNNCQWFVEFVSPPVGIGKEIVQEFNSIDTPLGTIRLLHPVDTVKDRLSSFFHWADKEGLNQAINICLEQEIDFEEVERWSLQEDQKDKFEIFKNLLKKKRRKS